jgi:hypothetical protein
MEKIEIIDEVVTVWGAFRRRVVVGVLAAAE